MFLWVFMFLQYLKRVRSHSETPALKTEDFSKKLVVLINANMNLLKPSPGQKTLENKEKNVLVNPFSSFTKTTDFIANFVKGRGS